MLDVKSAESAKGLTPRERIIETAYELFSRRGVRAVGVDEVIAKAQVAKATLYRHFPSKDDLVIAFLERREERWMFGWVQAEVEERATDPEGRLLAIFDVYGDWFAKDDFEGCAFVNVLSELGADHPAGAASARHLENLRAFVRGLAEEAGLRDPDEFTKSWYILMKGSIVAAGGGDAEAANRAQDMGRMLIERYR